MFSFSKQGNPLIITSLPSSSQDYYSPDIVFAGEFLDPVYYSTNLHLDYNFDNNISSNKLVIPYSYNSHKFICSTSELNSSVNSDYSELKQSKILKNPLANRLLKFNDGFWTYIVSERDVKQIRMHSSHSLNLAEEYLLGRFIPRKSELTSIQHLGIPRYFSQTFYDGDICEQSKKSRTVEICFVCHKDLNELSIISISETSLCNYVVVIGLKDFCTKDQVKDISIHCSSETVHNKIISEIEISVEEIIVDLSTSFWNNKLLAIVYGKDRRFPLIKNILNDLSYVSSQNSVSNADTASFIKWMSIMGIETRKLIEDLNEEENRHKKKH